MQDTIHQNKFQGLPFPFGAGSIDARAVVCSKTSASRTYCRRFKSSTKTSRNLSGVETVASCILSCRNSVPTVQLWSSPVPKTKIFFFQLNCAHFQLNTIYISEMPFISYTLNFTVMTIIWLLFEQMSMYWLNSGWFCVAVSPGDYR